jgi:prolyl-tRNA editing enzyme YbaK/EbsC (Cys-tRNA(Pro) deacylase)
VAHPNVDRVTAALRAAGVDATPVELTASGRTAVEAAAALGCPVGAIASSIVFAVRRSADAPDREPLLVVTSGAHRVDVERVAKLLGVAEVGRADAAFVRAATGFPIGGVAPVAHPQPVRILVDNALAAYDVVWAAAGTPHAVFPTSFDTLVRMTGGQPADVGD